ncbi:MAG TPA: hypothetical protein VGM05_22430 [Planctomycetaceae bacterium]|jgi:hypothetical protein
MSARAQKVCRGLIAAASCLAVCCLVAGCIWHAGSTPATAIGNRELPVGISGPRLGRTDVDPSGFSSTYQRYQLDRRRLARQQAEQDVVSTSVAPDQPASGGVVQASAESAAKSP